MTTHQHTSDCQIEHGTYRCYVDHGCRRPECREAWRVYGANRNRQIAYGRHTVGHPVSGALARVHIEWLLSEGMTITAISGECGVARITISRIRKGEGTSTTTQEMIRQVLPGPQLATDETPDTALVDGAGTRRRLRALAAEGWTSTRLAERHGGPPPSMRLAMLKGEDERTLAVFARSVREIYEELWDQEPPCTSRYEKAQATRARKDALQRGWAPPMAWDEESIDDPAASAGEWREVSDLGSGRRRLHLDDLEDCISWGLDIAGAAGRLGVTKAAVEKCAYRAERRDVLDRLRINGIERAVA